MSKDRVVDYHIGRLQDKRESVRLDAIEQLRLLEAIDALDALEDVYRNDPDEDVRRQAKQAGRELFGLARAKQDKPGESL